MKMTHADQDCDNHIRIQLVMKMANVDEDYDNDIDSEILDA